MWRLAGGRWQVVVSRWQVEGGMWPNCLGAVRKAGLALGVYTSHLDEGKT